jgi:hypothetical protein
MSTPDMVPVDSSNVLAIGYDASSQELHVEYLGGRTYVYSGVPDETHQEFVDADSKGAYMNREIKPNYEARPL